MRPVLEIVEPVDLPAEGGLSLCALVRVAQISRHALAQGASLNETVKQALRDAVERRRRDPKFKAQVRRIIEEDRELLERLAR